MGSAAGEAPPAAKRRKKSKNKFKPGPEAQPQAAPPALHATNADAGVPMKKQKKKAKNIAKRRHVVGDEDETVGVQADAPGAVQQQAPPPHQAAAAAGSRHVAGGGSAFALPGKPALALSSSSSKRSKGGGGGSLLQQMRARLQGGRFRWLNEALYTSDGAEALAMVQKDSAVMQQYHEGFREQTKGWPVQPVDQAIAWLLRRPAEWVVADLGCGDAKVAASLARRGQRVHSFDLASTAPGVVACNMADVPLPDGSVDVAVFCLSLMGTDYGSFLEEAARLLRPSGWLWIAEVQSRFVDGAGRSVLPAFEAALGGLGFTVRRSDTSNSHFLVLEAQRTGQGEGQSGKRQHGGKQQQQQQQGSSGKKHKGGGGKEERGSGSSKQQGGGAGGKQRLELEWPELRPCQYKKR